MCATTVPCAGSLTCTKMADLTVRFCKRDIGMGLREMKESGRWSPESTRLRRHLLFPRLGSISTTQNIAVTYPPALSLTLHCISLEYSTANLTRAQHGFIVKALIRPHSSFFKAILIFRGTPHIWLTIATGMSIPFKTLMAYHHLHSGSSSAQRHWSDHPNHAYGGQHTHRLRLRG